MQAHPLLNHVVLGYGAVVDRQRSVVATRLTLFPEAGSTGVDGAQLLQLLASPWPQPESGARKGLALKGGPVGVLVNAAGEGLLRALLAAPPDPFCAIEVPAFMLGDAALAQAAAACAGAGGVLALNGAPRDALPAALAQAFALRVDDTRGPAGAGAPLLRLGVQSGADLDAAFAAGAAGGIGWPFGDAPQPRPGKKTVAPDLQVIMDLINRVEREEPVDRLEAVLKNDPTLAFRLLRYINSPGFGLSVEVSSFRHALMMLGYQRLKRWLALLLASAGKSPNLKPVMHAAVRRGLLMEELVKGSGGDAEMRSEVFICGVFSLLDRLLEQPFDELLRALPVPQRVQQALLEEDGPFAPYLQLAQAVEQASALDVREGAARLMITAAEVNRSLLAALASAAQLE
ncbi:MAG: HDOD domain-containing protein [Rubrivivax sp.]